MADRHGMPEPLTPEHCDLRSHTYFPLHYDRLLRSKWWRRASDFARSRNVDLWAHAFREVPAASLPDDDADLADLAGFGRDIAAFQRVKAELLEPWILCDDGRWYHPTLAEVAGELWDRLDGKRKANAARQSNRRKRLRGDVVTSHETASDEPVTRDAPHPSRVTGGYSEADVTLQTASVTLDSGAKGNKGNEINTTCAPEARGDVVPTRVRPRTSDKPTSDELAAFEGFWAVYPLRKGKQPALKAFVRLLRSGEDLNSVLLGAAAYAAERAGMDPSKTKYAQGWLNDRRWEDERGHVSLPPVASEEISEADVWRRRLAVYQRNLHWPDEYGPRPSRPGCRAPPEVLAEFAALTEKPTQERAA